jgi:Flp pilus assembly protein TadG
MRASILGRYQNGILVEKLRAFLHNEKGASIIFIALTMPAFIGGMGLAAEVGYWQLHHRAMQNAADAAAIAAATNNGSSYATEAQAVASQYNFTAGTGNVTVSATNPNTAAGCTSSCYVVTVTDKVPLLLSQIVGYEGSSAVGGQRVATLSATAVASTTTAYSYCILALATSGTQGIRTDGSPNANLNGCNTMSNNNSTCNGHNLNATEGDAAGTNNGCGNIQHSGVRAATDSFSGIFASANISNTCSSYPQEGTKKNGNQTLPNSNQWNGNYSYSGVRVVCGDQQLTGNTTLNNTVLVIENGMLDTNGYTFKGTNVTVVFSGTNTGTYQHIPTDTSSTTTGTFDIAAPTSGTWSGIAMYQDPSVTKNVDVSYAGNNPTWDITGLVYLPHSSVTISGAVNKSSSGLTCFELVVDNVLINGTANIFGNDSQCAAAGLNQTKGGSRGALVN